MDTWHSILSPRNKPWTLVSPLSRIPPYVMITTISPSNITIRESLHSISWYCPRSPPLSLKTCGCQIYKVLGTVFPGLRFRKLLNTTRSSLLSHLLISLSENPCTVSLGTVRGLPLGLFDLRLSLSLSSESLLALDTMSRFRFLLNEASESLSWYVIWNREMSKLENWYLAAWLYI